MPAPIISYNKFQAMTDSNTQMFADRDLAFSNAYNFLSTYNPTGAGLIVGFNYTAPDGSISLQIDLTWVAEIHINDTPYSSSSGDRKAQAYKYLDRFFKEALITYNLLYNL